MTAAGCSEEGPGGGLASTRATASCARFRTLGLVSAQSLRRVANACLDPAWVAGGVHACASCTTKRDTNVPIVARTSDASVLFELIVDSRLLTIV